MSEAGDEAVLMNSTHTGIIDRLKPTGSWKIVVVGVSSGCESQGLLSTTTVGVRTLGASLHITR